MCQYSIIQTAKTTRSTPEIPLPDLAADVVQPVEKSKALLTELLTGTMRTQEEDESCVLHTIITQKHACRPAAS